ncbi:UNVERIFIED_CONTAM: hypothetical protein GTU68_039805 [Idotea baltica]|nr:hypothetical protein [Idotea baltica]
MILDVDPSARGPQIIITRSHPDFLNKLFELEVPEINEDVIEIKGTAREPGERAKIAVRSVDGSIDPVGACVGIKGSRVHAVVQELRGEKIDIIPWTPDFPSYVARALSPAEVSRVVVDEDSHSMEVIVADDQLSYAIGRRGQNVKLASKLTGWKLDVRSVTVAEEEAKVARAAISSIPGMQVINAERLFQEGYRSVKDIAEDSLEDLLEIEGLTAEVASEILKNAKEHLNTLELQGDSEEEVDELRDLDSLMLESDIKKKLVSGGFDTIQSIVEANDEALETIEGLEEAEVEMVQKAVKGFFTRANLKPEF